ncbi:MAG: ATP-binding protein [Candidatus Omnitrophica bacterium]|nr:ATP-binding protein [Candidatus Omnitrophota bacterium]
MKKLIILVIIMSFVLHDIGWAYVNNNPSDKATLAPEPFSNIENSAVRANLLYVINLVEHVQYSHILSGVMTLDAVQRIIEVENKRFRPEDRFPFVHENGYVQIDISEGYHLYYYDPAKIDVSRLLRPGHEQVGHIEGLNKNLSRIFVKDIQYVSKQCHLVQNPEISKFVNLLESPSENIKNTARQDLIRMGEDPQRWEQTLDSLRLWREENDAGLKRVADFNLVNSDDDYWFRASVEYLDFIWSIINDPSTCSIDEVEDLIKKKSYNTGRRAYLLSGKVSENKVVLRLPDGPLGPIENDKWRCDHKTFPDGPENFFKIETTIQSAAGKEPEVGGSAGIEAERNEVATIAYSIEGDAIRINQFLVNKLYDNRGVATWLFKWLVSDILATDTDKKIKKIRFDYHCMWAKEFLLSVAAATDGKRVIIGPYYDEYGEFYLLGEFFEDSAVDERMVPDLLIGISKNLIDSINPALTIDEALMKVVDEIDTISAASGCTRLIQYLPIRDKKIMAADDKSAQDIKWEPCYQRGLRTSGVKNEPLRGEKRLLEMMMVTNEIEPIIIPDVCEFKDGMWMISDRQKLIEYLEKEYLKEDGLFNKVKDFPETIADAKKLLSSDLKKAPTGYGPNEGNSVLYCYAIDHYKRPLFLFAVVGRLTYAQEMAVATGFRQSRAAAKKIYELEALRAHTREVKKIEAVAALTLKGIVESLPALFHALGTATVVAPARLSKTDPARALKIRDAEQKIREIESKAVRVSKALSHFNERIRDVSSLESPDGSERTATITGFGRAAQSTINIYHLLLMADTMDDARKVYAAHFGGRENVVKDFADSFAVIARYFFEKQRLMTLGDIINDHEYQQAIINFESIEKDVKEIPALLRDITRALSEWKEDNVDIFERIQSAPGALNDPKPFFTWLEEEHDDAGAKLPEEEKKRMIAAFYINGYLPIFEETIPFTDYLIAQEINKKPIDIIEVIGKSIALGENQARASGLRIPVVSYIHKDAVVRAVTDPEILKFLLIADLVKNAIKYSRPDGEEIVVTVDKAENGKYVRISVRDTGVGISETDRRDHLFKQESRLEATRATVAGTGLGLYFARKAALQLGGQIILEESVVGQGSTFTIYLPMGDSETVWPVSQDEIDLFNDKVQRLSHITADLRAALLTERNLVDRTQELNPSQGLFPYWDEFNGLISDLEKAAAIQDRLKEDLAAGDLSAAYLDDALRRRIGPLVDPIRMKQAIEHVKAYREGAQVQEGTTDALKEILTTLVRDEMPAYLESLHNERMAAAESAQPLILISEKLFNDIDAEHLKGLLTPESGIQVCDPDTIARSSTNKDKNYSKEKLVCILDRDTYKEMWKPGSAERNNNLATLIVLEKGAFEGTGYLHLEGVAGLALAMAAKDDGSSADRVLRYIKTLFEPPEKMDGGTISETELEEYLRKDTIEFFDRIRLNLKHIEPFKTESLLERYKLIVENYLTAA